MQFSGRLILVAAGASSLAQVVDLNSNNTCTNLPEFPTAISGASGGVIEGSPMICGERGRAYGQYSDEDQNECYAYDKSSQAWKFHAYLKEKRRHHSSVVMNGALWVLGGYSALYHFDTTEYIYANGTVVAGPNLPTANHGHCSVTLHDGKIMIIGGYKVRQLNTVQIFSPKNNSFIQGPSLINRRYHLACALFFSPMHDNRPVVLSAGGSGLSTAEVLDYTTENAVWQESKLICQ